MRFLTAHLTINPYNNGVLRPLFKKLSRERVNGSLERFTRSWKSAGGKKEAGLYLHFPYCAERCTFCHCSSCQLKTPVELDRYCSFLKKQIQDAGRIFSGVRFSSVYCGGGTPSLLTERQLADVLRTISGAVALEAHAQVTFEAHPASLSPGKMSVLRKGGVSRISLGVQSMDPRVLSRIGRVQQRRDVVSRLKQLKRQDFPVVNVDLVAGLPGQTLDSFTADLQQLLDLGVDVIHINPCSNMMDLAKSSGGEREVLDVLRRRKLMVMRAKEMLGQQCYGKTGLESYSRRGSLDVYHESSFLERAGSVIGLGVHAMSNLRDEMVFRLMPGARAFTNGHYEGIKPPENYSRANYMIFHLLKGLDADKYRSVFGDDPHTVFKTELQFLESAGIIHQRKGVLAFKQGAGLSRWMDYFAYTKIFYGEDLLERLRVHFAGKYRENVDYREQRFFLNFFQDIWVASLYHDVGL